MFGLESLKPILTALILPPVPLLLLVLIGARLILPRRGLGWLILLIGVTGLWLSCCQGTGQWLQNFALRPPMALSAEDLARLRLKGQAHGQDVAIVVLGGGMVPRTTEYRSADLSPASAERLRYAMWLSRQTGLPMAFSGGVGWGQQIDPSLEGEAVIASRVAQQTYGLPLGWVESHSSDTRGNAALTIPMLRESGVKEIVLVTHAAHMRRAQRQFEAAAAGTMRITIAPMGYLTTTHRPVLNWLPSIAGYSAVSQLTREIIANAINA